VEITVQPSTASGKRSKPGRRDKINTSRRSNGKLRDHCVASEARTDLLKAYPIQDAERVLNYKELN